MLVTGCGGGDGGLTEAQRAYDHEIGMWIVAGDDGSGNFQGKADACAELDARGSLEYPTTDGLANPVAAGALTPSEALAVWEEVCKVPVPDHALDDADGEATTTDRPMPPYERSCPGADRHISYHVSGNASGRALVTYSTPSGIAQSEQRLPFDTEYCFGEFDFATISVQNPDDSGTVSCRIVSDGEVLASNSSSGAYVIASCDE